MIKKKALLTVAAAAAVLMANPTLNKAEAASYTPEVQQKVYVYQGSNMNEINSIIEKYLASFGITMPQTTEKQPIPTTTNSTSTNTATCTDNYSTTGAATTCESTTTNYATS